MAWWNWWTRWLGLSAEAGQSVEQIAEAEFRELLSRELPELTVQADPEGFLLLQRPGEDEPIKMNLPRMAARMPEGASAEERQATYASWLEALHQILAPDDVSPAWASKLLVRLVTPDWMVGLPGQRELVARAVPGLGLYAAVVFDFPTSVRYVTHDDLEPLGLSEDHTHERALQNLRERMPADVIRRHFEEQTITSYMAMDSYEAARILVIPELLEPGEAIGVAIPDRDSLVLFPADSGAEVGAKLSESESDDRLLSRGVRVTRDGFELL